MTIETRVPVLDPDVPRGGYTPPKDEQKHVVERISTKLNDPCLKGASDDEPIFVLRAQDILAPITVIFWCLLALLFGAVQWVHWDRNVIARDKRTSDNTLRAAFEQALRMRNWARQKLPD